ncbi:MAG: hypothetical protein US60_C0027G0017 [Microgenomates group bacterium GW2011_GWC1_37_8]|nr:MAG: hypothetical protein US60_C0027G0017 [Microgenomates group bacterium GW2011_GWC1_37_8]
MSEDLLTIDVKGENLQVGAKLLAVNEEGKYLLIRKNPEKYPNQADTWDIPGGRWTPGREHIPDTIKRELEEESGLEIISKPEFIAKQKFPNTNENNVQVVRLTYRAKVNGQLNLNDEHLEAIWVTLDQMKDMDNLDPQVKELLDQGLMK